MSGVWSGYTNDTWGVWGLRICDLYRLVDSGVELPISGVQKIYMYGGTRQLIRVKLGGM